MCSNNHRRDSVDRHDLNGFVEANISHWTVTPNPCIIDKHVNSPPKPIKCAFDQCTDPFRKVEISRYSTDVSGRDRVHSSFQFVQLDLSSCRNEEPCAAFYEATQYG